MGSNGSGYTSLIILLLPVLLIAWMFWSANRRQKAMRDFSGSLSVGDAVVTSSGLFGTIRHLDDQSAFLEVADGVTVRFDRRAIAMKQTETRPGTSDAGTSASEQ